MIVSLFKIIGFVLLITAVTLGVAWFGEMSGGAVVTFGGYEITLRPFELLIVALLVLVAVWIGVRVVGLIIAVLRFINGDDTAISRYLSRSREKKGIKALSDAVLALAAGEGKVALSKAQAADKYLGQPEVTHVLLAHAAEIAGDRATAEQTYKELLAEDRTRFVALRGLMRQKLAEGDSHTALKLAEEAFRLKPSHIETQDVLLRLQAESNDWAGARATLGTKSRQGVLPKDVVRRRDAVLALAEASTIVDDKAPIEARERAIEANRLSPDLIPAAVLAARTYLAEDNPRYAARVLRKAWEANPHPDLAEAFAEIVPNETPEARLSRFEALTNLQPEHPETRMLKAELLIAAGDFPAARRALGDLAEVAPTTRSIALMASIERGSGANEAVVRGWLTRALTAPRGPQWVCGKCAKVHSAWTPICEACQSFDTLEWKTPAREEFTMPGGAAMMPVLVGAPAEEAPLPPVTQVEPEIVVLEEEAPPKIDAEEDVFLRVQPDVEPIEKRK